jgi:hypothetical protein
MICPNCHCFRTGACVALGQEGNSIGRSPCYRESYLRNVSFDLVRGSPKSHRVTAP